MKIEVLSDAKFYYDDSNEVYDFNIEYDRITVNKHGENEKVVFDRIHHQRRGNTTVISTIQHLPRGLQKH